MAKFKKTSVSALPTDRFIQLQTEFYERIVGNDVIHTKIGKYFDVEYVPLYNGLFKVFNKPVRSVFTEMIKDVNVLRIDSYVSFCESVRALTRHPEKKVRNAALEIKALIDKCGSLARKSLDGQTACICDLLSELTGLYAEYMAILNIDVYVENMKSKNDEFIDLMDQRFEEKLRRASESVRSIRSLLTTVFHTTCNMIESLSLLEDGDEYDEFIAMFNVIFQRYITRKYTAKKEEVKDTEAETEGNQEAIENTEAATEEKTVEVMKVAEEVEVPKDN